MTIETVTNKTIQSGNGSNKDFDFAFEIPDEDSLSLTKRGSDGTETAITTNFTVTGIGDEAGGTVNYPTSGSALGASEKIIIKRVVSLKQNENLRNQGDYSLEDIEDALDRSVMMCQQLQEQIDRSLKLPLTSSSTYATVDDFVANKLLYVSSDGTKVKMSDADFGAIQTYLAALTAIAADISAVAAIDTEVTTVAGIDTEVTTVAGIAAAVTSVAAIAANVSTVAAISANVTTVAGMSSNIASVVANMASILNAASFGFPNLGTSDVGKFLKVKAGYNGYDLVAGANLTLFGALTALTNGIPYFDTTSSMAVKPGLALISKRIIISNNASDATNDIDFAAGTFDFDDQSGRAIMSASTGQLDVVFGTGNGMLMTGSKANSTFYDLYAIYNPTTLTAKPFAVVRGATITLPTGYTKKAKVGTIRTNGSGVIHPFNQKDRWFTYKTKVLDRSIATSLGTASRVLLTVSCPSSMLGHFTGIGNGGSAADTVNICSPDETDAAASSENSVAGGYYFNGYSVLRETNSSSQIALRAQTSGYYISVNTQGWFDHEI